MSISQMKNRHGEVTWSAQGHTVRGGPGLDVAGQLQGYPGNGRLRKTLWESEHVEREDQSCSFGTGWEWKNKRRWTKGHLCLPGWLWTNLLCNDYVTSVFQARLSLGSGQGSIRVEQKPPWESQDSVFAHLRASTLECHAIQPLQTLEDTFQLKNPGSGGGRYCGAVAARGTQADRKTAQGSAVNANELMSLWADIEVTLPDRCWPFGGSCWHSVLPGRQENKPN